MSQYDRKYDGPPIQELRHAPYPDPPPQGFRERGKKKAKNKGPVVTMSPYIEWPEKRPWFLTQTKPMPRRFSPFSSIDYDIWGPLWTRHVLNRLKACVRRDTNINVMWVEDQATGAQISPEFSNTCNLIYWLEFEGLRRDWLRVEVHDGYHGRYEHYKEC